MDLANFLWVPRGLALKAEYAKSVQDIFDTRVRDADFTRVEDVRQIINQRIETKTRGNIKEIFPRGKRIVRFICVLKLFTDDCLPLV